MAAPLLGVKEGRGTGKTMSAVFYGVKCDTIGHFDCELIPRDGRPYRDGGFPLEQTRTAVAQI